MNELTLIKPIDYLPRLQKHGIHISESDFKLYLDESETLLSLRNSEGGKEKIAAIIARICMTYLNIDPKSDVNVHSVGSLTKTIISEYGQKITALQLEHAFNMQARSKIDVDLTMYGTIKIKPILDMLNIYTLNKQKAIRSYKKELESDKLAIESPSLNQEEGAKYLFDLWKKSNQDSFDFQANRIYAVGYGKKFVKYGLLELTDEQIERVKTGLESGEISAWGMKSIPSDINNEDGTILYEKKRVKIPLAKHRDFKHMDFDDILTFCLMYAYWKNNLKPKKDESEKAKI